MIRYIKFSYFLFAVLFIACKSPANDVSQNNPLYDQVMFIHDKVMPQTATIHTYIRELKAMDIKEAKDIIYANIQSLEKADEAMMAWMADFKIPVDTTQTKNYLTFEKSKISNVSDRMFATIDRAKIVIDSLKVIEKIKK